MSFATSTELFQSVFLGSDDDDDKNAEEFFEAAANYLATKNIATAITLHDWIVEGNPVYGFICRPDIVRETSRQLIEDEIPFLCVTEPRGDVGFLFRSVDSDATEQVKEEVLKRKARFCKVVTSEELKADILKSGVSDKEVLYISGLTPEQAEILRSLCEEELDEEEVGFDEMNDGTFTFSFPGHKAFKKGKSLSQVLILMMLESLGFMADVNKRVARNTREFNRAMARGFQKENMSLKRTPAWIVGSGKHYMKLDGFGFEYGVAVEGTHGVDLEEQYSIDAASPDYQAQLNSYLARIEDKTVTYDASQASRYLSGKDDSLSFALNRDGKLIREFEEQIAEKVNEIVSEKIHSKPVMKMDGRWDQKLNFYLQEAAELIDGARMDRTPDGYMPEDIKELRDIADTKDLKLEAYKQSIHQMRNMEMTLVEAEPVRIQDVGEKIQGAKDHSRSGQDRSRDRERTDKTRS